ncbi:MAG: NERD domain-containing protein [Clostridia bacterium]|nr:NERD domain-containing protein [Clostridia bacterium]
MSNGFIVFIICMCLVVCVIIALIITFVYRRRHKKPSASERAKDRKQQLIAKGIEGEDYVESILNELGEPVRVFRDIVLDTDTDLGTTEIDFIVITENGVFILDVKSWDGIYKCDVTKTRNGKYDYDLIVYNNRVEKFLSCDDQAIMRNAGHYNAVCKLIADYGDKRLNKWLKNKVHSYVVFRQDNFNGQCDRAINAHELIYTIRNFHGKLDEQDIDALAEIIRDHHSRIPREQHIENLLKMFPNDYDAAA